LFKRAERQANNEPFENAISILSGNHWRMLIMRSARFTRLLVLTLLMLAIPVASFAGIFVSITVAPPPLPVYVQPVCPQPGYMWSPGYWSWGDEGYYWVPGTWVAAPSVGMLWTPGYWGWSGGFYRWNAGYWGPHIGFYGGVNYGFGYGGAGFVGGEWRGGGFFYNSAVMNVGGAHITNVYVNKTVIVNNTTVVNNVSYNGGAAGTRSAPTPMEQRAAQEHHIQATPEQSQHETAAAKNPQLLAKNNGGKPAIAATAKPADFSAKSAVPAKAAGGRVEPATLNASAKAMPPAAKTAAVAPHSPAAPAFAPANHPTSAASTPANHNVPKPPTAAGSQPMNHAANQPAQHVQTNSAYTRSPGNSSGNSRPPVAVAHAAPPQHQASAPQHQSKPPAEKENKK
jgi:hypothetical protein